MLVLKKNNEKEFVLHLIFFFVVDDNSDLVPAFKDWPSDPVKSVEQKFLTKMPEDFMAFWEMCKTIDRENPREALVKSCGLLLVRKLYLSYII